MVSLVRCHVPTVPLGVRWDLAYRYYCQRDIQALAGDHSTPHPSEERTKTLPLVFPYRKTWSHSNNYDKWTKLLLVVWWGGNSRVHYNLIQCWLLGPWFDSLMTTHIIYHIYENTFHSLFNLANFNRSSWEGVAYTMAYTIMTITPQPNIKVLGI